MDRKTHRQTKNLKKPSRREKQQPKQNCKKIAKLQKISQKRGKTQAFTIFFNGESRFTGNTVKPRINRFEGTKHDYSLLLISIIANKEYDRQK